MKGDPCSVCGGTDVNLVDGFYYCVECGTQDENVQETVVAETFLGDGTFTWAASKKFTTALKEGVEMSSEWYKWHTYNFILCGLADELVALGASPSFKMKVLWVWTRYIRKYQVKEDPKSKSILMETEDLNTTNKTVFDDSEEEGTKRKNKISKKKNIEVVTKQILLTILYIALNLDHSDIQLAHLLKYMKERQLNIVNCTKFIPKELDTKLIPHWNCFARGNRDYTPQSTRTLAMSLFNKLNLGTPLIPNVRKLIDDYITELCLPDDFKNLVFSLMNLIPYDYLDVNKDMKKSIRIPDFEEVPMAYVLVALKMCFGLDDNYELMLSDCIDQINAEENKEKSYRIGLFADKSDRLFSFREWCNFLQFRKVMLCKYYLPFSQQYGMDVDDHVFMEQLFDRPKRKPNLGDDVTMDILKRIPLDENVGVIPKKEFPTTLTPISTYTRVILEYIQDPEIKLLLSEDFSQYSLKYACKGIELPKQHADVVKGVSVDDKTINSAVVGTLVSKKSDLKMVYVRNCENRNWLKTKPPTKDHIELENTETDPSTTDQTDIQDIEMDASIKHETIESIPVISNETNTTEPNNSSDKDSDHGYDSTIENTPKESKIDSIVSIKEAEVIETKPEILPEEQADISIFDDTFADIVDDDKDKDLETNTNEVNFFQFENDNPDNNSENILDNKDSIDQNTSFTELSFNPDTFDRKGTIKELVTKACKKYKIPIPPAYKPNVPERAPRVRKAQKRDLPLVHIGAGVSEAKKPRHMTKQEDINQIIDAYYKALEEDVLGKVSEHVQSMILNMENTFEDELVQQTNDVTKDESGNEENNAIGEENAIDEDNNAKEDESVEKDTTNLDDEEMDVEPDPRFDEKTHDISQLYVKLKDKFNPVDVIDYDDPTLNDILEKQLNNNNKLPSTSEINDESEESEQEDEYPKENGTNEISTDIEETKITKEILEQNKEKLEQFIDNPDYYKDYKYWFRHYNTPSIRKNVNMVQKFDLELKENCPKSFNFVIHECAAILDCTAYSLYKHMQNLEQAIIDRLEDLPLKCFQPSVD